MLSNLVLMLLFTISHIILYFYQLMIFLLLTLLNFLIFWN